MNLPVDIVMADLLAFAEASVVSIPGFADPFSSLSHLLGAGIFALLSVPLLKRGQGEAQREASLIVFSLGVLFLLTASGINHLLDPQGTPHFIVQRLDHAAIFTLIACSFTPIHVILFKGKGKWGTLAVIWSLAILGITLKSLYFNAISPWLGTALYIGMGWIGLGSWLSIVNRYGFAFARPIMWGGLAYTLGAVLDGLHWPVVITGIVQSHEVFHVAVLLGLGFHWAFIYQIADWPIKSHKRALAPAEFDLHPA